MSRLSHRPIDLCALTLGVTLARLVEPRLKLAGLLRQSRRLAGLALQVHPRRALPTPERLAACERTVLAVSRWVPGARCLHQACALRVWLACGGIDSVIEVGLRKRATFEGHAWVRVESAVGERVLLDAPEGGFHRVLKDNDLR